MNIPDTGEQNTSKESDASATKPVQNQATVRRLRSNPWLRLLLLACSAFLAVLIGRISESNQITLTMIIFGCLATGLISEKTLVKILPWTWKR